MNTATMIIYRHTTYQYDDMCSDSSDSLDAESLQQFWLDMMYDYSEDYDAEWFPIIALWEKGRIDIDCDFIVRKYKESRCIKFRE